MIRNLLASTAIATLLSTAAYAQVDPAPDAGMDPGMGADVQNVIHAEGLLAANVIGETVYNSTADDADNIGNVNDIIITEDGSAEAIVIGVGGFLGLGQKDVGIAFDATQWHERDGERVLVLETTAEQLEALPEFDRRAFEPQPADMEIGNTQWATAEDLGITTATTEDEAADDELDDPAINDAEAVDPDADEPADDATGEDELDSYDPAVDEDAVDDGAMEDDAATEDATNGDDAATDDATNGDATNGDAATDDPAADDNATDDATTGDDAATDDTINGDAADDAMDGDAANGDGDATGDEEIIEDDTNG